MSCLSLSRAGQLYSTDLPTGTNKTQTCDPMMKGKNGPISLSQTWCSIFNASILNDHHFIYDIMWNNVCSYTEI